MLAGVAAAVLAAVCWSLNFIAPLVIGDYSLFDFVLVQFTFTGVIAVALLTINAGSVAGLNATDWLVACPLGLLGYVAYVLAVTGAAKFAGPVVAPAFLGLVPIALGVIGNLREPVVPWRLLAMPLTMASVGLLLVNGGFAPSDFHSKTMGLGITLAIAAVACWTAFGVLNQEALSKRPHMRTEIWTALIMVGAGGSMLIFLPLGLSLGIFEIPRLGLAWPSAGPLIMWGFGLAVLANFAGAGAWTFASQRLPVAFSAQLITVEPLSAAALGLLVHRRVPSATELTGMVVLVTGVTIAIRLFVRRKVSEYDQAEPESNSG